MIKKAAISAMLFFAASVSWRANAGTFDFTFSGPGVSGAIDLTYGTATDAKYSQAFEVTGISGTFSDSNNGLDIVDAAVGPLVPITHATPAPTNLLAPNDFSRFAVAAGLPPNVNSGFVSYDNLYWPGGSPATASDYTVHGGFLDIYGLLFDIGNGRVVNFWSNGNPTGTGAGPIYGIAVATSAMAFDYVNGGVSATAVSTTPEPAAIGLLGSGLLGMLLWRRTARHK